MVMIFVIVGAVAISTSLENSRKAKESAEVAAVNAVLESKAREERIAKLTADKPANLAKGLSLLEQGDEEGALEHLRLVAEVDGSDEIRAKIREAEAVLKAEIEKAEAARNAEEESNRVQELAGRAKALPASEIVELRSIYRQLNKLRPDNGQYQQRAEHYARLVEEREAEDRAREAKARLKARAQLQLLSWSWSTQYGYATAEGRVKNISARSLQNIMAVVEWKTSDGTFITSESTLIEYNPLLAGQASPFRVMARENPRMHSASISFKTLLGGALPHYKE